MNDSYIALSEYFKVHEFRLSDFASLLFVYVLVFFVGWSIRHKHRELDYYRTHFMRGLLIKTTGGLCYALVYTYYYVYGGDTIVYWNLGSDISRLLFEEPQAWWDAFTGNFESTSSTSLDVLYGYRFARHAPEMRMAQVVSVIAPLGLMNFFAASALLSAICYVGVWQLFLTFRRYYPQATHHIAFVTLYFPTVVFWGSGLIKDCVVFSSVGVIVYGIDTIMRRQVNIRQLVLLGLALYLIYSMKIYVLFCLAPGLLAWRTFRLRERIKNRIARQLSVPVFIGVSFVGGLFLVDYLGQINPKYSLDNFFESAQVMQNWHYVEGQNTADNFGRGSSYSLGTYTTDARGLLKVVPAAINVTLFRPYPWEAFAFMQLLAALESLLILAFTLYVIGKSRILGFIKTINNDPTLVMMLSFSLIFAFAVGFSAYNFGALARYKVPCIPFYLTTLIAVWQHSKYHQVRRRQSGMKSGNHRKHTGGAPKFSEVRHV